MQRRRFLLHGTLALASGDVVAEPDSGIVVVGHPSLPSIDVALVQRLYTGRAIEAGGQLSTPINLRGGHPLRRRFLAAYLQTDEDRYRAYWTVRRHVGKGAPPRDGGGVALHAEPAVEQQGGPAGRHPAERPAGGLDGR